MPKKKAGASDRRKTVSGYRWLTVREVDQISRAVKWHLPELEDGSRANCSAFVSAAVLALLADVKAGRMSDVMYWIKKARGE